MKKYLLAITILLLSGSIYASNVFGVWEGQGQAIYRQGSAECESISVSINSEGTDTIAINKVSWKCGGIKFTSKKQILTVVDGWLFFDKNEDPIGRIDQNSLNLNVDSSGVNYDLFLAVSQGRLAFIKRVTSNKDSESMAVGGSLAPVN